MGANFELTNGSCRIKRATRDIEAKEQVEASRSNDVDTEQQRRKANL